MIANESAEVLTKKLHIKPFEEQDAGQVVLLGRRYFPEMQLVDPDQLKQRMMRSMPDEERSLVCCTSDGTIHAYLKVRLMEFQYSGNPVTGAIFSDFMANERARKELIPVRMLRQALNGPQDFSFSDNAANASRIVWCGLGGEIAFPHSTYCTLPLRPISFSVRRLIRDAPGWRNLCDPLTGAADRLLELLRRESEEAADPAGYSVQPLTGDKWAEGLSLLGKRHDLFPVLDGERMDRLIRKMKAATEHGGPRCRIMLDSRKRPAAWYICYIHPTDRRCNVIHAECRPGMEEHLYRFLVRAAASENCISMSGRLSPAHFGSSFSEKTFTRPGWRWSLVHSKKRELLSAIQSGRAFLSRFW